jgi:iron(III) transport system permease protein
VSSATDVRLAERQPGGPVDTSVEGGRQRHGIPWFRLVSAALGCVVGLLILYPLYFVVRAAFFVDGRLSLESAAALFSASGIGEVLLNTAIIAGASTVLAVTIASAFAWLNERTDARIGWLASVLPLLPLLIPAVAGAIGWLSLLADRAGALNVLARKLLEPLGYSADTGPLNIASMPGLIFLYTLVLMPFAYVIVQPAVAALDPALEEAARVSGAGSGVSLRKITLPALKPSITSGLLLTGIVSLALFSVPVIIGTQAAIDVISTRVYRLLTVGYPPQTGPAVVLTVIVLSGTLLAIAWQRALLRRNRHAVVAGKSSRASLVRLGAWKYPCRAALLAYLLLSAIIPLFGLIYLSFQAFWSPKINFQVNFSSYSELFAEGSRSATAIFNSAWISLVVATLTISIAAVVASYVNRSTTRISRGVDGLMKLPATMSQLVLAVGVLLAFTGKPFQLGGTSIILIIGFLVLYIALASFSANASMMQISNELTEAGRVNGAELGRVFMKIQLPLMTPTLIGGWVLVFVAGVSDVTASALLGSPRTPVAGFEMLQLMQFGSYPQLAALGVLMTISTTVLVGVVTLVNRRSVA